MESKRMAILIVVGFCIAMVIIGCLVSFQNHPTIPFGQGSFVYLERHPQFILGYDKDTKILYVINDYVFEPLKNADDSYKLYEGD